MTDVFIRENACKATPRVGWAHLEKVARINWIHSSLVGLSPPEHFEPKLSVLLYSTWQHEASKVLASHYWRSKIRGRNFGLKLKFYYANRPLGTRKWHQNWNWTPNETFLFVKSIDFQELINRSRILLIKMFHLVSNSNSDVIFVFPEVDLHNRILISSQNSDLGFSTSSTARPKL